jgi:hypothetical protein
MKIISTEKINNILYHFYEGIDFNIIKQHGNDGNDGVIICFIKNWKYYELNYNRNVKIDNILNNKQNDLFNWDFINNNYVIVYQCENIDIYIMYEYIKENISIINKKNIWISVTGITKGAWDLKGALNKYDSNDLNYYTPYVKKKRIII